MTHFDFECCLILGINDDNIEDVQWCVTTTRFEKKAREAARQLFQRLRPIGIEDVSDRISSKDLVDGIEQLSGDSKENVEKKEKKLLEKIGYLFMFMFETTANQSQKHTVHS